MSDSERYHEQAINRALRTLEPDSHGTVPPHLVDDDEAQVAALAQEYTEVAALLAFAQEPEMPSPTSREQLLAAIDDRPYRGESALARFPNRSATERRELGGRSPWTLAIAAMFGLCLVGLAYLAGQQSAQGTQLASISSQRGDSTSTSVATDLDSLLLAQEALVDRLTKVEQNLFMVTNIARVVYPMRQVASATNVANRPAMAKSPIGKIFVCGQHQQWYLNVRGLPPPPTDHSYQLWFITKTGAVAAGILEVASRQPTELAAAAMPPGTKSFAITLEPMAGPRNATKALIDPILVADQPINL